MTVAANFTALPLAIAALNVGVVNATLNYETMLPTLANNGAPASSVVVDNLNPSIVSGSGTNPIRRTLNANAINLTIHFMANSGAYAGSASITVGR